MAGLGVALSGSDKRGAAGADGGKDRWQPGKTGENLDQKVELRSAKANRKEKTMTNLEVRYMETVAANLPRIAKALERIADSVEKPKALLRIADAVRETAARVQVVNDPSTWVCPQPPVVGDVEQSPAPTTHSSPDSGYDPTDSD